MKDKSGLSYFEKRKGWANPRKLEYALWFFTDMISGRLLAVRYFRSLNYNILHNTIEENKNALKITTIGFLGDKQDPIILEIRNQLKKNLSNDYSIL